MVGQNILCIAPHPWDDICRRRHHLMTRFARTNRVLWIEPPQFILFYFLPQFRKSVRKGVLFKVRRNLLVYRLFNPLPFGESFLRRGIGWVYKFNECCCVFQVKMVMTHLKFVRPILWLFAINFSEKLVGKCNEIITIFDVFDKYSAFSCFDDWEAKWIEDREKKIMRRVTLIFAVSEQLCAYSRQFNKNVFLVPNGVDITLWQKHSRKKVPVLNLKLNHPVLGYVGSIFDKVDLDLLLRVSGAYPQMSLLLIGPVKVLNSLNQKLLSQLQSQLNVYFVKPKFYGDLPFYYEIIDISLLPYAPTEQVKYAQFPTKLFEYMAARKPILAMDTFNLKDFEEIVWIAYSKEKFVQSIGQILREDTRARVQRGYEMACQNSWDIRVKQIEDIIESYLSK